MDDVLGHARTVARPRPAAATSDEADRLALGLVSAGHFAVDMSHGALPAFLAVFATLYSLGDVQAAMILAVATFVSSATQPVFGLLSDRRATPWFLWGGVGVAVLALAGSGFVGGYWLLLAAILVSGVGVAAFHPEAARVANLVAGPNKASGVGWFSAAGNLGFALGPLLAAPAILLLDERGTVVILLPGLAICAFLLRHRERLRLPVAARDLTTAGANHVRGLTLLIAVVTTRTWAQFAILGIGSLYVHRERGYSDEGTAMVIFAFTIAGAIGTIGGGYLADRIGARRVLVGSLPLSVPALLGFVVTDGALSIALLFVGGLLLLSSFSVSVVLGQEYLPRNLALAAGLMIGFAAIGSAALGLAWLAPLAVATSRETALLVGLCLPLLGGALALLLPRPNPAP